MQDLIDDFLFNQLQPKMITMGCMVDHIHQDKNRFSILFQKGTICGSLLIILFNGDCTHLCE
jgi:hypothetical protein